MTKKTFRILSEETVQVTPDSGVDPDEENPYWTAWEEVAPHPDPAKGCVRRGLCCKSSPGWFGPGEIEGAAALLGISPDELVRRYLVIDEAEVDGERVFVFAPVKLALDGKPAIAPASRADALYRALRGTCIFFDGQGCGVYGARPIECARYICTNKPADNLDHDAIARLWKAAADEGGDLESSRT